MIAETHMGLSSLFLADLLLAIHFVWAAWMIAGILLALLGFLKPSLWRWKKFRITHLAGLIGTASVPFWSDGLCPLTIWEYNLRVAAGTPGVPAQPASFIIHWMREILFVDVDPLILSIITGALALATVIIFILRPPWRV
ncbi:MAG: DUF2784 domain-containing protein [FCB group bacterium]|nr:DUF2784 domain-containing protein [FCB group bacterium]